MATDNLPFASSIRLAAWFKYIYLPATLFFCACLQWAGYDVMPNMDKLEYWMKKAIKIERLS